jgi:hypothetical protein
MKKIERRKRLKQVLSGNDPGLPVWLSDNKVVVIFHDTTEDRIFTKSRTGQDQELTEAEKQSLIARIEAAGRSCLIVKIDDDRLARWEKIVKENEADI